MDQSIDVLMDHFVYQPRKSPVNAQDIPFFLSTRLVDEGGATIEDGVVLASSASLALIVLTSLSSVSWHDTMSIGLTSWDWLRDGCCLRSL